MKSKLIQFVPTVLTIAFVGFTKFSVWCTGTGHLCYRTWLDSAFTAVINPLYFFSLFSLPIVIVLIFTPRSVFNSWLKFAIWAIPVLLFFIYTQPVFPSHILSTDRDDAARLAAQVFSVVSLIVMAFSFLRLRLVEAGGEAGEYQIRELKALVAAGLSVIAAAVVLWISFSSDLRWLNIFILSGIAFIVMILFSLYQIIVLAYKKRHDHVAFGRTAKTSMLLLVISTGICVAAFLIGIR